MMPVCVVHKNSDILSCTNSNKLKNELKLKQIQNDTYVYLFSIFISFLQIMYSNNFFNNNISVFWIKMIR